MADASQLGIAVIGAGRAGMIHARNFAAGRIPGAGLTLLVEPLAASRRVACEELRLERACADYREALRDPAVDAVIVATPSALHCEIVVAAAQAGKHVLCEKPMAMNAAECDRMLAAIEQAGVTLQIGFMRRFDAGFVAAKQRVDAGEIGRVVSVKSLTHGPTIPKPWMYDIRKSNGPLSEVNSHDIDTVRWLSGSEFDEVYAIAGNYRSPDAREQYPGFLRQRHSLGAAAQRHAGLHLRSPGSAVRLRRAMRDSRRKGPDHGGQPGGQHGDHPHGGRQHECDCAQLAAIVPRRVSRGGRRFRALRARTMPAPRRRARRQGGRDGGQCRKPFHRPTAAGVR